MTKYGDTGTVTDRRYVADAVVLGAFGAAAAWVFNLLLRASDGLLLGRIAGYRPPGLASEGWSTAETIGPHGLWLIPLVTTGAGLLVGILTTVFAPEAEGHGTDTVVRSFHRHGGWLRFRVAPVKMIASALTIGSGGSAGREGPIAMISAALGSWYAGRARRTDRERRELLLVGAAAGIAAIFRSPIGAALFAVEVLYADMEFEASALLFATLAAIVAFALSGLFGRFGPLFTVAPEAIALPSRASYLWFAILGIAAGLVALLIPVLFYGTRDAFRALALPLWIKPAFGGLLTGLVALALPGILGGGYGWMQRAIDGQLALGLLLTLALAKIVTMSFTIGSGGSGGVFAPSLYVGCMLGGAFAAVTHEPSAPFAVVGMAAVFAGAAHVPFATMMMVTEMTGGYHLLVPAALAVSVSYLVQRQLSTRLRYRSIYEFQVASRGESPAHHHAHLEIALRILRDQEHVTLGPLGDLDLVDLLRAGVPVDVGDGRRLLVGVLRPSSTYVGATIAERGRELGGPETNILAILRGEHMMAPRPETVLQAGDRLVLIAGQGGVDALSRELDPW